MPINQQPNVVLDLFIFVLDHLDVVKYEDVYSVTQDEFSYRATERITEFGASRIRLRWKRKYGYSFQQDLSHKEKVCLPVSEM